MVKNYTPERGDIVFVNMNPQAVKEQSGKRPALVLSPKKYNEVVGLAILCPITSQSKGYPFEVKISKCKTKGVVLADHVKNFDWKMRKVRFIEMADKGLLSEVLGKLNVLLGNPEK